MVNKMVAGMNDTVDRMRGRIHLTGWACDVAVSKLAGVIVVFFNNRAITAVVP